MKLLLLVIVGVILSGCYTDGTVYVWEKHPILQERAHTLCEEGGGVYMWGVSSNFGNVICYNSVKYNTFTQEVIE